ncbi:MAG: HypC/HybG/HupF family hydrogenase formation chaperone [Actinomycetota bacterium]|nr:HypC/HybG/HupF family hydrogenase formation chaperone [Actinomycetota bacterium]
MCLGIPGQIVEIVDPNHHRAVVDVEGVRREISVALLNMDGGDEHVDVGDWVLIHVGFAMAKIDEQEAAETLSALRVLGTAYDDEIAQLRGDERVP